MKINSELQDLNIYLFILKKIKVYFKFLMYSKTFNNKQIINK